MNIQEEFARLTTLASTAEGWKNIEDVFSDPIWLQTFAIDPASLRYKFEDNCISATPALLKSMFRNTYTRRYEQVKAMIIEGMSARFKGYELPIVLLLGENRPYLESIELQLIERNIALPVGKLFNEHRGSYKALFRL